MLDSLAQVRSAMISSALEAEKLDKIKLQAAITQLARHTNIENKDFQVFLRQIRRIVNGASLQIFEEECKSSVTLMISGTHFVLDVSGNSYSRLK